MILYKPFKRGLYDIANRITILLGGFSEFGCVVVCNAANEPDRKLGRFLVPLGGLNVAQEELSEAVEQEGMNGRMFSMPCTERTEGSQIAIGQRRAINTLDDVGLRFVCLLKE